MAATVSSLQAGLVIATADLDVLAECARILEETNALKAIERARDDLLEAFGTLPAPQPGDAYYLPDSVAQP